MARPSTEAVGLRLPLDLLARVNDRAAELSMNRSALICLALNQFLDGPLSAAERPAVAPSTSAVDQPARDGLLALKARMEAVEEELQAREKVMWGLPQGTSPQDVVKALAALRGETDAEADNGDDFAAQFAKRA